MRESPLLLALLIHLVESKVKDTSNYKLRECDESNVLSLAIVQSVIIPEITNSVKELDAVKNRKCNNSEAKDYIDSYQHNKATLTMNYKQMEEFGTMDDKELDYYTNILKSSNHYKLQRREVIIFKFAQSKDKSKCDNTIIKINGVYFTPLLIEKVKLGLVYNSQ